MSNDQKFTFIHTADWHLGYEQYQKPERARDFTDAVLTFSKQVLSMKPKPKFIIHSGDVFHHFRPTPLAFRTAHKVFSDFKKHNIPVYVIRGNHDAPLSSARKKQGDYVYLLKEMGLLEYLSIKSPVQTIEDNIFLMGIGYFGKMTPKILKEIYEEYKTKIPKDSLKILILHSLIEDQIPNEHDFTVQELASYGFDYYALGHFHLPWKKEKFGMWVCGSLEQTATNQWFDSLNIRNEKNVCKYGSYIVVDVEKTGEKWKIKPRFERVPVRPKIMINKNIKKTSPAEIESSIVETIESIDIKDKIAVFKFLIHGVAEQLSHLTNVSRYEELLRNAFHYEIKFDFTQSTNMYFLEKPLTENEIIEKYVEENVEPTKRDIVLLLVRLFLKQGYLISENVGKKIPEEELLIQIKNHVLQPNSQNSSDKKIISDKKETVNVSSQDNEKITNYKPLQNKRTPGKTTMSLEDFLGEE